MAKDIDRKLRVTAALLGTVTIKDLGAAFRRINPATPFDVERAHKWMQGRARPRELQVYEDWAKLLDLGQSGAWIAECDAETFLDVVCARHDYDREALKRSIEPPGNVAVQKDGHLALAGTYACYSHAWSPYYRGQLIRGELSIATASHPSRLLATYAEILPTGRLALEGPVTAGKRHIHLDLREPRGDAHFAYFLFPSTSPVSVLGGFMCGTTIIGPETQPSVTRIAMVRLPSMSSRLRTAGAYLPTQGSVAEDLTALGLRIADPATVDRRLGEFLAGSGGLDQIPASAYQALVVSLDREWLTFSEGADC